MSITEWDDRCKRCGRCCFEKIEDERGRIFYTQTACRYLDVVTRECRVFENRFVINPECIQLTQELADTLRWLPGDCGYRAQPETDEPVAERRVKKRRKAG